MQSQTKYMPHVDGLRSIAVMSVVLYHLNVPYFGGGYVGVDVFFVISGFLISRLILSEIQSTGTFQFSRFYVRRLRRLGPALLVTLLGTTIGAFFLLTPEYFQSYGGSLASAVLSVSNIFFWSESGYFDFTSRLKPLLHTWSLSVEEQFYLFWPLLVLFIVRKLGKFSVPLSLNVVGVLSFIGNLVWVNSDIDFDFKSTIFYLTPFRVFEFVIGALAVFFISKVGNQKWIHEILMLAGLLCISFSVIFYTDTIPFPYYYALLPCIGAFCMIVSPSSRIVGALVTNPVSVGIGLISYSLYLVHWPLIVFYENYTFQKASDVDAVLLVLVSLGLAFLMYRFVETPFRKGSPRQKAHMPQKKFVLGNLTVVVLLTVFGLQISTSSGWAWRFPGVLSADLIEDGKLQRFIKLREGCEIISEPGDASCSFGSALQVLVFGNSHEVDGYNIFDTAYGGRSDVNLIAFGNTNRCDLTTALDGSLRDRKGMECYDRLSVLMDREFINSLDVIIASFNMPFNPNKEIVWKLVDKLMNENPNLSLIVMGSYIRTSKDCPELYSRVNTFSVCKDPNFVINNPFNEKDYIFSQPTVRDYLYIDKTKLLCTGKTLSSCMIFANGEPFSYDSHHLSLGFSRFVGERMVDVYSRELSVLGFP